MARTHNLTGWNQSQQRKNRCNKQIRTPYKPQKIEVFSRCHPILRKIHTESLRKDRQHKTATKKRIKRNWTAERNTDFNKIKQELTSLPCLAHYNECKENIATTDACNTGLGVALWQKQNNGELKLIAIASRYLNDAEKKYSIGELELLAVVWGLERFDFTYTGKISIILRPSSTRTSPKKKQNQQTVQRTANKMAR